MRRPPNDLNSMKIERDWMKNPIQMICFHLVVCILLIAHAGCSGPGSRSLTPGSKRPDVPETIKANETRNAGSDTERLSENRKLFAETPILTIDGTPVYWPEFRFWLNYIEKYYRKHHHLDAITDWSSVQNGMPLSDFFLTTAAGYACKDRAIAAQADALGIKLSENILAQIEKKRRNDIRIYGSRSEYLGIIRRMYVSEEVFNYLIHIDLLSKSLFEYYYGAKGEKCADEDVWEYVRANGFMCAKYIFRSNTGAGGRGLSSRRRAENDELMRRMLERLDAVSAPVDLFDTLMNAYGQDPKVLKYPHGRLMVSGSMGKEFESAYLRLNVNEHSGIVQTNAGCYIILRMPLFPDMSADSAGNTLRYRTAYDSLFRKQIEAWCAQMTIEYKDTYYQINVKALWDK